ncbi:MAG: divalent-cation tolerance protein CutA [Chloroflexota bacterium]
MKDTGYIVVLITCASAEEAERISRVLLERRKAACVNLASGISSRFWWQGRLDSAEEVLLVVKSRASLLEDIIRLVRENHSYQVPEVVALPIVGGNPDYLRWLEEETS